MLGVLVNTGTVILGSTIGLLCKKGIPKRITDAIMLAIGLCTIYIGVSGTLEGKNTLVLIISMAVGTAIGTLIDIDKHFNRLVKGMENKFRKAEGGVSIAEGFITASLLFCVGAMTIVGSLQAGLSGDNEMLFTKSVLDFISAIILSASLGVGVMLSSVFVLVFQGIIVLLAQYLSPILSGSAIVEMTCAGSLLIVALGFNIIGITKFKVMNFLPAIFIPLILCLFM